MRLHPFLLAASAALVVGCTDAVAPPVMPPPQVERVVMDTLVSGAVVLDLAVQGAAEIRIRYWTEQGHALDLRTAAPAPGQQVFLPELEAGRDYQYALTAINAAGVAAPEVHGGFRAPAVPADLATVRFTTTGGSSEPLTMLQSFLDFKGFVIVNRRGEPVWWWRTNGSPQGFARRANGNFVLNDAYRGLYEVTPARQVVSSLTGTRNGDSHHDVLVTPHNTILYLGLETRRIADSVLTGDIIREWNPETGHVSTVWSVFDALDPATDVGPKSNSKDWTHANAIAYGDHGNIILSLNWLSQVVSIAPDFRSVEWRLGGPGSTFTLDPDAVFQGQHTAELLPGGRILLFDNGRDRVAPHDYSRALELALEPASGRLEPGTKGTARVAWSYRATPEGFSPYMSSARRLANGNTFVFFSLPPGVYGGRGTHGGLEVRPDGSVAFQLGIVNSGTPRAIYRGEPLSSILAPGQSALVSRELRASAQP